MKHLKFILALTLGCVAASSSSFDATAQVNQLDAEINIIPDKSVKTDTGVR